MPVKGVDHFEYNLQNGFPRVVCAPDTIDSGCPIHAEGHNLIGVHDRIGTVHDDMEQVGTPLNDFVLR